jgi:hypothetical protein
MKRAADTPDDNGKRPRRSLEFLGTCKAAWKHYCELTLRMLADQNI